jgi:hypothetical protein
MAGELVGLVAPPNSVGVVHAPLLFIANNLVGRDDEAVPVELSQVGDAIVRGLLVAVGMGELGELEEPRLAVRGVLG